MSLNRVHESVLAVVVELLKQAEKLPAGHGRPGDHLREREDKDLLERPAKRF